MVDLRPLPGAGPSSHRRSLVEKMVVRENAAFQPRHWVRLTATCNNNCGFCLDMDLQDGRILSMRQIKADLEEGRKKGRTRVILSGGEATIHPRYFEIVEYAKKECGYEWVQTVSNGRAFQSPEFCESSIAAGLDEITISIHGDTPELHDELVGAKGAYVQTMRGLVNMLRRRVIVSVDICLNRQNYQRLPSMMKLFLSVGVREFDILQVIPFGSAWPANKSELFYDIDEAYPYLRKVFALSQRADVHLWTNRFPVYFLEGFEDLIQDPHKLLDEVNGRREEYEVWLTGGEPLSCYGERCQYCFLENVCDTLIDYRRITLDRKSEDLRAQITDELNAEALKTWIESYEAKRLTLVGPDTSRLAELLPAAAGTEITLELDDFAGLEDLDLSGVVELRCATPADSERCLAAGEHRVVHGLNVDTAEWIAGREPTEREALYVRNHERVTESAEKDVDLRAFFVRPELSKAWTAEALPKCITRRNHGGEAPAPQLDTELVRDDGFVDIYGYTHHYVRSAYYAKSMRCRVCELNASCRGLHINYLRNKGFEQMDPIMTGAPKAATQPKDQRAPDQRGPSPERAAEARYKSSGASSRAKMLEPGAV